MAIDGVYTDDPSEAVAFVRDKVLAKKLLGGTGVEIRPTQMAMGTMYPGLARMQASVRMDLTSIPRVAIGPRKGKEIPVWCIPQQGVSSAAVEPMLAGNGVAAPAGTAGKTAYALRFPGETSPEQLVAFAQQTILAMGVKPGQGWQWAKRGRDQLPH